MSTSPRRPWRSRRETVTDTAVAALLFGLLVVTMRLLTPSAAEIGVVAAGWPAYATGAVMTLPLAARRRAPLLVLAVVTLGLVLFRLVEGPDGTVSSAALFLAFCTAGAYGRSGTRDAVRGAVVVGVMAFLAWSLLTGYGMLGDVVGLRGVQLASVALNLFYLVAAWVLGDQWRIRRERERQLADRTAELARERDRSAERAAVEERLRIARELHDVLGHHVSVMGVQAAGAGRVLHRDPDRAGQALAAIEESSRQAVTELQRVLSLLRDRDGDAHPARLELAGVRDAAADVRTAGVEVTLQLGALPPLPASVDLAVTRIVQEALTNTLRHAGPGTSAWVRVTAGDGALDVVVEDDGRGVRPPDRPHGDRDGHGLTGMRERVDVHGGRFAAGRVPAGGFRVAASLPLDGGAPTPLDVAGDVAAPATEPVR